MIRRLGLVALAASPQLFDITATILDYFNVPNGNGMIGQTVF